MIYNPLYPLTDSMNCFARAKVDPLSFLQFYLLDCLLRYNG